ncbi:MAG: hypothetical protein NC120_06120 [Ruminococcus sp.]|nr:hypothetical protein [Ruminococcus sp.]
MSEELYHYGVLGMKWGIRKDDDESRSKNRSRSAMAEFYGKATKIILKNNGNVKKSIDEMQSDPDFPKFAEQFAREIEDPDSESYRLMKSMSGALGGEEKLQNLIEGMNLGEVTLDDVTAIVKNIDTEQALDVVDIMTGDTLDAVAEAIEEETGVDITVAIELTRATASTARKGTEIINKGKDFVKGVYERSIETTKSYIGAGDRAVKKILGLFKR